MAPQKQKRIDFKARKKKGLTKKELQAAAVKRRKDVKLAWDEEVKSTKWVYDEWYRHPAGTKVRTCISLPFGV